MSSTGMGASIPRTSLQHLAIDEVGDVTVVTMLATKLLEESTVRAFGLELSSLVDDGRRKVVLNFERVQYLSSAATGKLIMLHRNLGKVGGAVVFCGIDPQVHDVFKINKTNKLFRIVMDVEDAVALLQDSASETRTILKVSCPLSGCGGAAESIHVHVLR